MSTRQSIANYFKVLITMILGMLCIQSCSIKEDFSDCINEEFLLYVKVTDIVTGKDITENGTIENASLYIFDHDGAFFRTYNVSAAQIQQKEPIIINDFNPERMIISAWGNLGDKVNKWEPDNESKLKSPAISLLQNPENKEYDLCPNDLFFGYHTIGKNRLTTHTEEVVITQKNAKLHITVKGLKYKENNDDYYFKIINQYNGYDFYGSPTPTTTTIKEKGKFIAKDDDYTSSSPHLLIHSDDTDRPTEKNSIWVSLYEEENNDFELFKTNKDISGNYITLTSGKTTNVLIDIRTGNSELDVYIQITPWDEIYLWPEY